MLRKILMVSAVPLGMVAATPTVNAQSTVLVCPYDLSDSGMTDEQIMRFCDDWERERRIPKQGSSSVPGKPVYGIHPNDFLPDKHPD